MKKCIACKGTGRFGQWDSQCMTCGGLGLVQKPKDLKDEFAMIALSVILKEGLDDVLEPSEIASDSYKIAEAMMKEREK